MLLAAVTSPFCSVQALLSPIICPTQVAIMTSPPHPLEKNELRELGLVPFPDRALSLSEYSLHVYILYVEMLVL